MNNVRRVYIAHTINSVATSMIGIYVSAYLLTLGYPLSRVILFYVITHGIGLVFGLFVFTFLVQKWGLINTFKLYYPLQIIYLLLLSLLKTHQVLPEVVGAISGIASFAYWLPMNIFLIKYAQHEEMGSALSKFFALPTLFSIIGPILGAILIPWVGFWPVFVITTIGIIASFLPLARVNDSDIQINIDISSAWKRLSRNKTLFVFEFLDNIIEESEWFWSIYVFIIIGSLSTPGIVGSLQAIGGAVFTFFVGKYANKYGKKLIPLAALLLFIITLFRIFVSTSVTAYMVTVIASFALTLFLVVYFSTIYKTVKNDNEEEFMILREIPTVLGRFVVFGFVLLTFPFLRFFFILPLLTIVLLITLYSMKKKLLV